MKFESVEIVENSCVKTETILFAVQSINQSINQSWIYIAHTRKASNAQFFVTCKIYVCY